MKFDVATQIAADRGDDDLLGCQMFTVVTLGTVRIFGFESQCLVTGVDGKGDVVHLHSERDVPNGTRLY